MARKAEATLWMLVKIGKRSIMKRVVKKGRGYVPKVEGPYEPGSWWVEKFSQSRKGQRICRTGISQEKSSVSRSAGSLGASQ
jgi:hypothetical protein